MVNIIEIATKAMQDLIKGVVDTILTRTDTTISSRQASWGAVAGTKTNIDSTFTNVGSNADASSATGSVHAKLKDLKASTGGVKSIQTGYVSQNFSASTPVDAEDCNFIDITISSVTVNKCFAVFEGGHNSTLPTSLNSTRNVVIPRVINTNTLRLAMPIQYTVGTTVSVRGRYTVLEYV